jgi:hypothetical protein
VSHAKFAPITSSLLVRKGDAAPSLDGPHKQPFTWMAEARSLYRPAVFDDHPAEAIPLHAGHADKAVSASHPHLPHDPTKMRRIVVSVTPAEYERLGIAAAKTGTTRHQIVRETMGHYFEKLAGELHNECRCLLERDCCAGSGHACGAADLHEEGLAAR